MSTFKFNPLTGELDLIYVPQFLTTLNELPANSTLTIQPNQTLVVSDEFVIAGTLNLQGTLKGI
jgi:hypothetical protein